MWKGSICYLLNGTWNTFTLIPSKCFWSLKGLWFPHLTNIKLHWQKWKLFSLMYLHLSLNRTRSHVHIYLLKLHWICIKVHVKPRLKAAKTVCKEYIKGHNIRKGNSFLYTCLHRTAIKPVSSIVPALRLLHLTSLSLTLSQIYCTQTNILHFGFHDKRLNYILLKSPDPVL